MFIRKIATDLCSSLKMLPIGGRLVFISDSRSWRKDVEIEDGGYKSGRVKDENVDWTIFFDLMQSFGTHLEKMGFIFSRVEGAEGDDLLLYWSEKFNDIGESCIIISGDKDLHQLLSQAVSIFDPFKQTTITLESFIADRHFTPQDLLLYHSLLGDSSDNIPGVKGIGAKTAEKLAQEYHTITSLYESIDSIKPARVQELLRTQKAEALISEKLFTLRYHHTNFALEKSHYTLANWNNAAPFFKAHEIKPFLPNGVTAVAGADEINPAAPPCNAPVLI
jgi:5'-3' exonuclease